MKIAIRKGVGFGLTSGIITTLGLIVGLHAGTHSPQVIISGILVIAVADALSDALGIHVSEEAENRHSNQEIWESTLSTLVAKFIFALTFIMPIIWLSLSLAIIISITQGLTMITIFSFVASQDRGKKAYRVALEHLIIAGIVILLTHYIGDLIAKLS